MVPATGLTRCKQSECNGGRKSRFPLFNLCREPQSMTDQTAGQGTAVPQQEEQRRQIEQLIQGALLGPVPKLYINGFGFAQTPADLAMIMTAHNQAIAVVNMSYTVAKSLMVDLKTIIEKFEVATGERIKTLAEMNAKISEASDPVGGRTTSRRRKPTKT